MSAFDGATGASSRSAATARVPVTRGRGCAELRGRRDGDPVIKVCRNLCAEIYVWRCLLTSKAAARHHAIESRAHPRASSGSSAPLSAVHRRRLRRWAPPASAPSRSHRASPPPRTIVPSPRLTPFLAHERVEPGPWRHAVGTIACCRPERSRGLNFGGVRRVRLTARLAPSSPDAAISAEIKPLHPRPLWTSVELRAVPRWRARARRSCRRRTHR